MNDLEFKKLMFEILKISFDQYDRMMENSLANNYPDGPKEYFKKRIFELILELKSNSIGSSWVLHGCVTNISNEGLVESALRHVKIINKSYDIGGFSFDPDIVVEQIRFFARRYAIIKELKEWMYRIDSQTNTIKIEINDNTNVDGFVSAYFSQVIENKGNKPLMEEDDINQFLIQNFRPVSYYFKTFKLNCTQPILNRFMWELDTYFTNGHPKIEIAKMMILNFDSYKKYRDKLDDETVMKSFLKGMFKDQNKVNFDSSPFRQNKH